ncbi:hypothetical protein [Nostoc sp. ChiQUE01b]|uniref:hypothetical protein n=1 Tax=Nostoc sp. ChiQUE01b TaxID=3075376 RepID=UPI002AD33776|nr:hypothetical protein [Nostoc sp. ChiQUE01b]MDZ8260506.1 hypothetical protein [Nostoc sp. ChiQUE01b]
MDNFGVGVARRRHRSSNSTSPEKAKLTIQNSKLYPYREASYAHLLVEKRISDVDLNRLIKEKKDTKPMNLFMEKKKCKATLIQAPGFILVVLQCVNFEF